MAYKNGWNDCVSANTPFGSSVVSAVGYGNGFRGKKKYLNNVEKNKKMSFRKI